ncbi:MAG: hypothetical protein J6M59_06720 [Bacteroidaceae bacterium]|nr:hypothetical protein [Bacteroidaceae bacterium]
MEFVDKSIGSERAHNLLVNFLNRCLNKNPYPENLYVEMKDDTESDVRINPNQDKTYKLLLKWILEESHIEGDGLNNDEGYCCYCMRRIKADENHSTLEHVIPKSVNTEIEYNSYFRVNSELERNENIMILKTKFDTQRHRKALPCPHNVAYENLVASCDGCLPIGSTNHVCCNGPRDAYKIPPIMFMRDIRDQIKYKKSGGIIWKAGNPDMNVKKERAKIINNVLCLNHDILKCIRRIWCYLAENGLDCNLDNNEKRRVIDTLTADSTQKAEKDMLQNFLSQTNYWNLLDQYRYFNDVNKFT